MIKLRVYEVIFHRKHEFFITLMVYHTIVHWTISKPHESDFDAWENMELSLIDTINWKLIISMHGSQHAIDIVKQEDKW